jgi:simple sugar transport system substrate-binding protein
MPNDKPREVSPERREFSRRRFLKNAGMAAAAMPLLGGVAEILSEEGAGAATYRRNDDHPFFAAHPRYHFVAVNHVTTNSFFTATIYGIQDACALLGASYTWTGSTNSVASDMISAIDAAIAAKAKGILTTVITNSGFQGPIDSALNAGIPIVTYNSNVTTGYTTNSLAYIGQSNLTAGAAVAEAILRSGKVTKGDLVAFIIATPGTTNLQPRIQGAIPVFAKAGVTHVEVGTSATEGAPELSAISSWYASHKDVKWMMSVDGGDSDALATFIVSNGLKGKVFGSGWDVGTPVVDAIHTGALELTVDQQAYLQGFVPIVQLFLYNISGGLMKPGNTDTGTGIVVAKNVSAYLRNSRWEGTGAAETVFTPPSKIPL